MARILVISDIHQDDRALEAIFLHVTDFDEVWFLGDVVGHGDHVRHKYLDYDGNTRACYEMLQHYKAQCIIGNWEFWLLNPEKDKEKNSNQHPYKKELEKARKELKKDGIFDWISSWKQDLQLPPFTLMHGSIDCYDDNGNKADHPSEVYLKPGKLDIVKQIVLHKKISTPHMLFGHTHVPGHFTYNNHHVPEWHGIDISDLNKNYCYKFNRVVHFAINPGSANLNRKRGANGFWSDIYGTTLEINTDSHTFTYRPVMVG